MSPPGWLVVSIRFYIVSTVHVSTIKPPYIILSVSPILRQNPETNLCMCIGRKASLDDLSLWFERFRMLIRFYPYVGTIRNKCKRQDPPLITLCVVPLVFLQFHEVWTHHCPSTTPLVPRTRVCMALMAIGTSISRLMSRSDLKISSLILLLRHVEQTFQQPETPKRTTPS